MRHAPRVVGRSHCFELLIDRVVDRVVHRVVAVALLAAALLAPALSGCGPGASPVVPGDGGVVDGGGGDDSGAIAPAALEVMTKQGTLVGNVDGATRFFLGIPYAAPPTGDGRFRAPRPPAPWTGKRDATTYGPQCPQLGAATGKFDAHASEDCLSLNIWTPAVAPATPRPVMVWIHGGGFILGSGSDATYIGRKLSEAGGVVVVTLNYRLGPLGFLALGALDSEDPQRASSGNFGIEDQRQALRWVRDNIAAFGGDPANVTLFGESAGGISTCMHLVSPESQGLFHRAIVESGFCSVAAMPHATMRAQGDSLVRAVHCDGLASDAATRSCLRALTAQQVTEALPQRAAIVYGDGVGWGPNIDGVDIPDSPARLFAAGKESKVPLLQGANADEGTLFFALGGGTIATESDVRAVLTSIFPAPKLIDAVLAQYPVASFPSAKDDAIRILGDFVVCDARRTVRWHSAAGNPSFLYNFSHPFAWIFPNLGAFHSAEIPFVFGNPYEFVDLKPEEKPLVVAMQGYWTRHAIAGDPNVGAPAGTVAWPPYAAATDQHLQLDLPITPGSGLRKAVCDFWDGLLPK